MEKIKKGNQEIERKTTNMKISYITCKGKQPIYLGWTDMSREELEEKYRVTYNNGYNRGIRTGFFENESYGILGLDIDDSKKFDEFIQNKGLNRDEIMDTLTEETPSGSIHYYYKIDDRLKWLTIGTNYPCEKVDYRCNRGLMICYGSRFTKDMCKKNDIHRCKGDDDNCLYNKKLYKITNETEIKELPESLLEIFMKKRRKPKNENIVKKQIWTIDEKNKIIENIIEGEKEILKLLFDECYEQKRFDDYDYWIRTGMALKNRYGKDGMEIFIYYSRKGSESDTEEQIVKTYENLNKYTIEKPVTISTLYYYAKEDNKKEFTNIIKNRSKFGKLELTSTDIVKYIKMLTNDYVWVKETLYCYNGKYWIKDKLPFMVYIGNDLYEFIKELYFTCFYDDMKKEERTKTENQMNKLKNLNFKKEIIETSRETLTNNDIEIDDNGYLLGFNNMVYDLKENKFREYKYDDYVSTTTGYDWIEPTEKQMETIKGLINSIFPNEEERNTFLNILSTGLEGRCLERFCVFNGCGRNGKGVINDLYMRALGRGYSMIANNSILFEKRKTGCNPEFANLDKKRYVVFRELPAKCKFENSIVKEITGGGNICARGLYESQTTKELHLTCVVECNKKPIFAEEPQRADMERIVDILFKSNYTEKEEEVDEENGIYRGNPLYKDKDFQNEHKYALLKIIFEVYKEYSKNNYKLIIPKSIKDRSMQYLEMSSDILGWVNDNYVKTDNKNDFVKLKDMWKEFTIGNYYENLPRAEKRKYTEKYFVEQIKENIFLKKYYYEQKKINNVNHRNILFNHTKNEPNNEHEINE